MGFSIIQVHFQVVHWVAFTLRRNKSRKPVVLEFSTFQNLSCRSEESSLTPSEQVQAFLVVHLVICELCRTLFVRIYSVVPYVYAFFRWYNLITNAKRDSAAKIHQVSVNTIKNILVFDRFQ